MAILRRRHPGAEPHDIDLGPLAGAIRRSAREPRPGAPVGDMSPVLTVGGFHPPAPDKKPSRLVRGFGEVCGQMMKIAKEPCGLRPGHKDVHRTAAAIANHYAAWERRKVA